MQLLKKFLNSFRHAFRGVCAILSTERNMRFHLLAAIVVIACGVYFKITATEWSILALCIGAVMAAEALNTAVESLTDLAKPEYHPLAGKAKDAAAGAVLLIAIAAAVCGMLIFRKYFFPSA